MEWIKDERRPGIIEEFDTYGKSKRVVALISDEEPIIVIYNRGVSEDGESWEQWYSPAYEDVVEDITAWCDCIPEF